MKKTFIFLFFILFISCAKKTNLEIETKTPIVKNSTISYDEALYLIEKAKSFEFENNINFQEELIVETNNYFENTTIDFLEKEYSPSGSFSNLGINQNKSKQQIFEIWRARINNYYSSLAYIRFIKKISSKHIDAVTKQRKKEIQDILNFSTQDKLTLTNLNLTTFEVSEKTVLQAITKSNDEILNNIIDLAGTIVDIAGITATGGASAALNVVEIAGVSYYVSNFVIPSKDETKEILRLEYYNFIKKNKVNYIKELDNNTSEYYDQLLLLIEKRKNEKILL